MKKSILKISFLTLIFSVLVAFLYRHCISAHLLDDFLAGLIPFQNLGWNGFSSNFGFPSLYYVHNLFFYGFYSIFGLNKYAWHGLFILFTGFNTALLYLFIEILSKSFSWSKPTLIALFTSLMFLFSPYLTENVVWAATIHYQISFSVLIISSICIHQFVISVKNYSYLLYALWIWVFGLLSLEVSLVFPAVWVLLSISILLKQKRAWFKKIFFITLSSSIFIVIYFITTKWIKGHWIPHYGADVHLKDFGFSFLWGTFLKYILKLFFFVHFYAYENREFTYLMCENSVFQLGSFLFSIFVLLWMFSKIKIRPIVFIFLSSFILLLPALSLYFMYLMQIENDRLSFFAIPFLYWIVSFFLSRLKTAVSVFVIVGILFLSKLYLGEMQWNWIQAGNIQANAINTFKWENYRNVYCLNNPQNFRGAYIFRDNERFSDAYIIHKRKNLLGKYHVVAGLNIMKPDDKILVEQLDSITYKISKDAWGWFWNNNKGAFNYETEVYKFELNDNGYIVRFNKPLADDEVVIFQEYGNWKEVK